MSRLEGLKLDAQGLIPAILQDHSSGEIRMLAWMSVEALEATLASGRATFYSRSKGRLWVKGESSGNFLQVVSVHCDCDADTLLLRVTPLGPTCHTGKPTCFFRSIAMDGSITDAVEPAPNFLYALEREIAARRSATASKSYTRTLLDGGAPMIGGKVEEEAAEFSRAIAEESNERVVSEAADVLYHLLVGLRLRDVELSEVLRALAARSGVSGLTEKAQRNRGGD